MIQGPNYPSGVCQSCAEHGLTTYSLKLLLVPMMPHLLLFLLVSLRRLTPLNHKRLRIFLNHGIIFLFDVDSAVPTATWLVKKAKGGGLAFLPGNQISSFKEKNTAEKQPTTLVVYVDGDHEYIIFDPYSKEQQELTVSSKRDAIDLEEPGRLGYTSIYGELPEFNPKKITEASILPSERPWETIFSGPSHALPPLTKLCSAFLESLLEKRTSTTG